MGGPVVFVSDLGLRDEFVGVCHLVIARLAPDVRIVDLSHGVPPHDIQSGAMMLANGLAYAGAEARAREMLATVWPRRGHAASWEVCAVAEVDGADVGLGAIRDLPLDGYVPFHVATGDLLARLGHDAEAADAYARAAELTTNDTERAFLAGRRDALRPH